MSGPQCSPDRQSKLPCRLGAAAALLTQGAAGSACASADGDSDGVASTGTTANVHNTLEGEGMAHMMYSCVHDLQTPMHTLHLARADSALRKGAPWPFRAAADPNCLCVCI